MISQGETRMSANRARFRADEGPCRGPVSPRSDDEVRPDTSDGEHMSQRLTTPMVRDDGILREATWEEALQRAADGFRSVLDAHGPTAFGMLAVRRPPTR